MVKYVSICLGYTIKKKSEKALFDDNYAFFWSNFIYKGICCGYSFELHRLVDAIQMSTHNICLYKEVKKKYTGCNLKTTEFLDCALIGVCAVIRSNTVFRNFIQCHKFLQNAKLKTSLHMKALPL